jgi:phage major head subunit gpT-like protein
MLTGNVPKHLTVGVKTGFLSAFKDAPQTWRRIAQMVQMDRGEMDVVDLGAAPMPTKNPQVVQDYIEKSITVKPQDWYMTVWISQNAIDDDQTGSLERKARQAGRNFDKHINNRVFTVLNGGDSATYGLCYDGQHFFDNDHVDEGAHYQTNQDNEFTLALSLDNFETVEVAAQKFVDDQGEHVNYNHDLLVCAPDLKRTAFQIVGNPKAYDTANNEKNPYSGDYDLLPSPQLDSTAWYLVASSEEIKPILVVMRKSPTLNAMWFDPQQEEGGIYYWQWHARYEMYYADWRLAAQGNT